MALDISVRGPSGAVSPRSTAGLVRGDGQGGHYYGGRKKYLLHNRKRSTWRRSLLTWLREHVWVGIPRLFYRLVLGHDLHTSVYAELYVRHYHATERDPFTGEVGWWENVGLVSRGKVTTAFRDFEVDQLVAESSEYGDFKFHRPGLGTNAESNADTALQTDAGLEATGTQLEGATSDIYKSVATVTADATETWEEHSIRSQTGAAGGTMMDRSLISPNVPVVNLDTVEFTYQITKNAEA